jgi:putative endonuclease
MRLGERGEWLAAKFLKENGYNIVEQNYKTPLGEIDIIAQDNGTLAFVEVKTRESIEYGMPYESVDRTKRRRISRVALLYLKRFEELPLCRFDVLSICYKNGAPQFELIKDAFEAV